MSTLTGMVVNTTRSLDGDEVRAEMTRIGLSSEQAKQILQYNENVTGRTELGVQDLINAFIHVLGNSIPALSASDVVMVANLFSKYDENGDGNMDLVELRLRWSLSTARTRSRGARRWTVWILCNWTCCASTNGNGGRRTK